MDKYFTHDELVFAVKKAVMDEKQRIVAEMEAIREKFCYDLSGVDKFTLDRLRHLIADYYNAESKIIELTQSCIGEVNTEFALRMDELKRFVYEAETIPVFNLADLGLGDIPTDGNTITLTTDTSSIITALEKGVVRFHVNISHDGNKIGAVCTMLDISTPTGGQYLCTCMFDTGGSPMVVTIIVANGTIIASCSPLAVNSTNDDIPLFDLIALGISVIEVNGDSVTVEADTSEMLTAMRKGAVAFKVKVNYMGIHVEYPFMTYGIVSPDGECYVSSVYDPLNGFPLIVNLNIVEGSITANAIMLARHTEYEAPTTIDLTALDTEGKIVEIYSDGTKRYTTIMFDENGNPVTIIPLNGNNTTILW